MENPCFKVQNVENQCFISSLSRLGHSHSTAVPTTDALGTAARASPAARTPLHHGVQVPADTEEGFLSTQTVLIRGLMNLYVSLPLNNIFCFFHSKFTEHSSRFSPHPG